MKTRIDAMDILLWIIMIGGAIAILLNIFCLVMIIMEKRRFP